MSKETLDKKKLRGIKKLWFQTIFGSKKSLAGKKKDFGKKIFFFFGGGGSKKGLNKKNCVKDIFWVKNFLVKGIFGVRKFCSKKFKVEKCFKVEKILWSKSFWSLKLLLHYSFCEKVHFHILQESFEFLAAMSSSRSDSVSNAVRVSVRSCVRVRQFSIFLFRCCS